MAARVVPHIFSKAALQKMIGLSAWFGTLGG